MPGRYRMTQDDCGCTPPCRLQDATGEVCTAFGYRYALILLRTLTDAGNATDMADAHKTQDSWTIEQETVGKWEIPDWNQSELTHTRNLLLELKAPSTVPTTFGFFTGPERIDHLFGILNVAAGWGGIRPEDQTYTFWNSKSDHDEWSMTVPKVPIEGNGFWSITAYNKEGFMFANPSNYNSAAQGAKGLNADGSTTVYFGSCDKPERQKPSDAHCLPIQPGWGMVVRFFRPSQAILDGSWVTPSPVPITYYLAV